MNKLYRINFPDGMEDVFIACFQNDVRIDGMGCLFTPIQPAVPIVADFNYQSVEQFKVGDKVIFTGASKEQIAWGDNDDPNKVLIEGEIYTVAIVEQHSWHTKLSFEGIVGKFNSVSFVIQQP